MEILVAMSLTSVLILVLALAFRSGAGFWRRLGEDPAPREILLALPASLARDFDFLATLRPYGTGVGARWLPFCGTSDAMAFWTRYAPEGAALQGVHLVAYVYDAVHKELMVYRLKPPLDADVDAETRNALVPVALPTEPVGQVPHVEVFELSYENAPGIESEEEQSVWAAEWPCDGSESRPRRVRLRLGVNQGNRTITMTWTFSLEPNLL